MKTTVAGIIAATAIGLIGGGAIAAAILYEGYDHDPQKLLELRRNCLEHDVSFFTTYCDDYAERYSRIPKKQ